MIDIFTEILICARDADDADNDLMSINMVTGIKRTKRTVFLITICSRWVPTLKQTFSSRESLTHSFVKQSSMSDFSPLCAERQVVRCLSLFKSGESE